VAPTLSERGVLVLLEIPWGYDGNEDCDGVNGAEGVPTPVFLVWAVAEGGGKASRSEEIHWSLSEFDRRWGEGRAVGDSTPAPPPWPALYSAPAM